MTPDANSHNNNLPSTPADCQNLASGSVNTIQRDRFELLSAYLDGEVTAAERRQVEEWLANDPTIQRLHMRLLKLHQGFQNLPVPVPCEQSTQQIADSVFAQVDRRARRRTFVWGGAAIAALFVGALATVVSGERIFAPQVAESPKQEMSAPKGETATNEPVLVALDKPLVEIPKAPVSISTPPNSAAVQKNSSNQDQ
jgi:hypothetical protein